ncbi:conserved Plasmodium protein, unknown function [Plasmodium ovale]|uniref:PIR protein n=1 Tax=Plasmodium ovale TaxID=36330 RepID=A0A1D3TMC2_PLAOA|nr:conserved Plasmodium protein, unknown function [Plasmodium ovale]
MNLFLLMLNCLIIGNLKKVQSRSVLNNEGEIGASEEAIKKLKEIKKLELDILNDFMKKDTDNADIYKKYHCIASDYISPIKKEKTKLHSKTEQSKIEKEPDSNDKDAKSESFIDRITSFIGIFNHSKVNMKHSDKPEEVPAKMKKDTTNGLHKEENSEIAKNEKGNSYMQLSSFNLVKKNMFFGGKDNSSEHFEVGNLGSFYMIFGARNTDYPWACTCDPLQLIDYKEKKRRYVLCSNQVDMSIQNADLFCNPKNSSHHFYLSYIVLFLIIIIYF